MSAGGAVPPAPSGNQRETQMITALLIVLAVLCAAGLVGTVVAAMNGCLVSSVWLMCGGAGHLVEFLGGLVAAILDGLNSN
jgi:hypothetical protein